MTIGDKLYDLKQQQDAVFEKLHAAKQDLRILRSAPTSPSRDTEVKRAKEAVKLLQAEFDGVRMLIFAMSPSAR